MQGSDKGSDKECVIVFTMGETDDERKMVLGTADHSGPVTPVNLAMLMASSSKAFIELSKDCDCKACETMRAVARHCEAVCDIIFNQQSSASFMTKKNPFADAEGRA